MSFLKSKIGRNKLEEIRQSRVTPINHKVIKKHNYKAMKQIKQLTEAKIKQRKQTQSSHSYDSRKYENHFSKLIRKIEEQKKKVEEQKQQNRQRYLQGIK